MTGDRGSITAFVAGFTLALLVLAGLVVDGGHTLNSRREAANLAEAAARAGTQALDTDATRAGNSAPVSSARAIAAANNYLSSVGASGTVTVDGTRVHVTVTLTRPTLVLRIVGMSSTTVTATGEARTIRGITEEGR